ncbi:MAG TPA: Gfo/Idh/MocA family oxidoreductase [Clostridiales bacterium]|mgnify:CR=1 FL=1|nr:MAG: putative oxidoreductase YteT precursor [Firmicutes bacterium ADurb.Bin262]HOU09510.1 Gfo/Idh/MocA family oxidoreductase [Clostridiales bacterium]HQH62817.1 Gfo/Idh/MocA family oxidoreductase [Clostridiales bacterium]HQK73216.1 Gfo/Idh/MocA family oxidoreductase [Clostridiales bacterium]
MANTTICLAVAGLAHGHGIGFLREAVSSGRACAAGFFDPDNPSQAETAAEEFGAPVYGGFDEMLDKSGADAVLTAAVNAKKAPLIIRTLEKGLGVIADKPLVTRIEDAEAIGALLERGCGRLCLMLTERCNPVLVTAKKIIDSGEIGEPVNIIAMRPHRLKPAGRPAWMFDSALYGGILNDLAVHDIDIVHWLSGSSTDAILASETSNRRFREYPDFEDNGQIMLRMKNGCTAFILVSWLTPERYAHHGEMKFIVHGTQGQICADPQNGKVTLYSDRLAEHEAEIVTPRVTFAADALNAMTDPSYVPVISGVEALQAQKTALLCQKAARRDRS